MKKLIFKLLVFLSVISLLAISFLTKTPANRNENANIATTAIPDTQFIIGAYDCGVFNMYDTIINLLHFNTWHQFVSPYKGWNYDTTDNYLAKISDYEGLVATQMNKNNNNNIRTIMSRPIIDYVGAGQRIDYQFEQVSQGQPYWFWAYENSVNNILLSVYDTIDNSKYGTGEIVKCCRADSNHSGINARWIDSSVRANRELSFIQTNQWMCDSAWGWYIMPRIRIDSAYAAGTSHNSDTVCRIILRGWTGNIVKDILIRIENFKDRYDNYNGYYLDTFNFQPGQENLYMNKELDTNFFRPDPNDRCCFYWPDNSYPCNVDIEIYWAGKVDTWFDRVRVENEPAHQYMTQNSDWILDKVDAEIEWANSTVAGQIPNYFYFGECEFSHFPAIKELNKQVMTNSQNPNGVTVDFNYNLFRAHIPGFPESAQSKLTVNQLKKYLYEDDSLQIINMYSYPLGGWTISNGWGYSYHPYTLLNDDYSPTHGILSYKKDIPSEYDDWLQNNFDNGDFTIINKKMDSLSKYTNLKVINVPQTHLWFTPGEKHKEPSNEELELMTDIALTYNAKGIMYYMYTSEKEFDSATYNRGIMEIINNQLVPRHHSVYGQDKFGKICEINEKLKKWGPVLMSFIPDSTRSYIYRLQSEKALMRQNTYFRNFSTFRPGTNQTLCEDEDFYPQNIPSGLIYDCQFKTFLQIATFKNSEQNTEYFMIVNRRCSPYINDNNDDNIGGRRQVRAYIEPNYPGFANFRNRSIINCETDSVVAEFDDSDSGYVNLGYFQPGEGRLYKIVPTIVTGGTLVCDEEIGSVSFECKNNIYSDGYDIIINSGATVSFHSGVEINMEGGNFICGDTNTSQYNITLSGKEGAFWNGLNLTNCPRVRMYGTRLDNAQRNSNDSSLYSINLTNCTDVIIQNSKITSYGIGAVSSYIDSLSSDTTVNYFSGNVFELEEFSGNTVRFVESGYITVPVRIEYCTFNSGNNYVGNIAIFLSNVSAGSLKYNQIEDYNTGVTLLNSSVDLLSNAISSSLTGSILLNILSGSNAILGYFGSEVLGGYNALNNSSDTSFNITVDNSTFYADEGHNNFRIKDKDTLSYHFYGNMSLEGDDNTIYATNNCFYTGDNIDTNICLERTDNQDPITAITYPMAGECSALFSSQMEVFQSDGGINDTIYLVPGGGGGSIKSEELRIQNYELKEKTEKIKEHNYAINKDGKISYKYGPEDVFTLKSLYSDLCVQTRKRNYDSIIIKATQLINQYPDSLQSLDAISKLYFASLRKDSAGSKMSPLKSYLEALILNNPNNTGLIEKSFYLVQKCKVALKQYQSALAGFQQIITENPYTYEALLASWDYAATTLLMNGGTGGSKKSEELRIQNYELKDGENTENLELSFENYIDNYDSTKFTKTDRVKIFDNTKKSFDDRKKKEKKAIEVLQSRSEKGDRRAQRELHIRKTISEVAKPVSPKSINEHIKTINSNIIKVFTNPNSKDNNKNLNNNIPTKYELFQNYPNPFNPVTKISFDLPKDSKVKLIVYDILGREIARLINNEFKSTGKHIIEFNGVNLNLASGVYFYRIEADKFNAVKKMVLIK